MTRKHFQLIADALNNTKPIESGDWKYIELMTEQWLKSVEAIADALATTNDRFDKAKFIAWAKGE